MGFYPEKQLKNLDLLNLKVKPPKLGLMLVPNLIFSYKSFESKEESKNDQTELIKLMKDPFSVFQLNDLEMSSKFFHWLATNEFPKDFDFGEWMLPRGPGGALFM